jgi:hypothetical protein
MNSCQYSVFIENDLVIDEGMLLAFTSRVDPVEHGHE